MILPSTYALTLAVLIFAMLCWGSWANTLKMARWRFELFYLDFSIGAVLAAIVAGMTLGSMGPDISVQDNFLLAGKRQIVYAFGAGCVFNLGNMLVVAAIELAGMSVALPVAMGLALIVGAGIGLFSSQAMSTNPFLLAGGCVLVLMAIVFIALAHSGVEKLRRRRERAALAEEQARMDAESPSPAPPTKKKRVEDASGTGAWKAVAIALAGGLLIGSFYPMITLSMDAEIGLTNPYAVALVFSIGILISTFIYNLYFMNLPVKGLPISFFAYFTGTLGQHFLGLLGGIVWMMGTIAAYAGAAVPAAVKVAPAPAYALEHAAALVAALWGFLVWKEFADADGGVKRNFGLMLLFFALGIGAIAFARSV